MRGRLLMAALSTIFLTTSLWAQRGGMAGGHAGFAGHAGGFSAHGPVIAGRSGAGFNRGGFTRGPLKGVPFGTNGFRGRFGSPRTMTICTEIAGTRRSSSESGMRSIA